MMDDAQSECPQRDRIDLPHSEKLSFFNSFGKQKKQAKEGSTHFFQNANSDGIVDPLLSQ